MIGRNWMARKPSYTHDLEIFERYEFLNKCLIQMISKHKEISLTRKASYFHSRIFKSEIFKFSQFSWKKSEFLLSPTYYTVARLRNLTFKRDCIWYKHNKIALSVNMFLFTFTSCQLQIRCCNKIIFGSSQSWLLLDWANQERLFHKKILTPKN